MSCALTIPQVVARTKTVTRRAVDTWATLSVGDELALIEKGMGPPQSITYDATQASLMGFG